MRKVLAATMTCLIVLLWAVPSFAQSIPVGKFDVRLKLKSNDCVAKKVVLQLQVKAHDANSTFKLGDANFRFDYDPTVVINPKNISQENFSNAAPASDANYAAQTLNGSKVSPDGTKGIVSLNVLYSGSNAGAKQVGVDYITVACIQFDIVKTDGCINYKWHTDNVLTDFPVTGMNEIIEISADPYDYNNPVVAAGGLFENYNVCLNTLCVPVINRDAYSTTINTPVSGNILTNDTPASGLAVKISPFPMPLHGSLTLSTDGTFTYTPTTGYVGKDSIQYEACDANNTCGKAWVVFTVNGITPPTNPVDLSLIKTVSVKKAAVSDLITYTVSITNQSTNTATGVSVKDYMPAGVLYKSYSTSTGTYDNTTGIWTIGNVSSQQTINLMITVQAQVEGTFFNRAEVWTCNEPDVDSKPGNTLLTGQPSNPILEDDNATDCFYVPIGYCTGSNDVYEISVPTGYTGIQWYKNGTPITGQTGTTLTVTSVGSYTFTTLEGACPAGGCCPAEFIPIDCCKPAVCVPYSVTKTKSAKK